MNSKKMLGILYKLHSIDCKCKVLCMHLEEQDLYERYTLYKHISDRKASSEVVELRNRTRKQSAVWRGIHPLFDATINFEELDSALSEANVDLSPNEKLFIYNACLILLKNVIESLS